MMESLAFSARMSRLKGIITSREFALYTATLTVILGIFSLASQYYLSQTIDDMVDVAYMSEFGKLVSSGFVTNAWTYPITVNIKSSFDANIFAPIVGNVVNVFVQNWVVTQRVVAFLLVLATAMTTYYVIRRLGGAQTGALLGAVAFAYSNEFIMRMPSHLSLLSGFVFPILLLSLVENRRFLTGLSVGLAYWCGPFFGAMALVFMVLFLVYEVIRPKDRLRAVLPKYLVAVVLFAVMVGPLLPVGIPPPQGSTVNTARDLFWRNANAYLTPGSPEANWEQTPSYLGLITLGLAIVGFVRKPSRLGVFLFATAAVFVVISLVPPFVFPFTTLREVTRFVTVSTFSLAMIVGLTFSLPEKMPVSGKTVFTGMALAFIIADNLVAPPAWYFGPAPYQWSDPGLAKITTYQGVAEVHFPILPSSAGLIYYQYYGSITGNAVVDGQTSGLASIAPLDKFVTSQPFLRRFYISNFTDKWSLSYNITGFSTLTQASDLSQLRQMGIDYIVFHPSLYATIGGSEAAKSYLDGLQSQGWLQMVWSDSQMTIYRITA